jgi:fatty acid desaturase
LHSHKDAAEWPTLALIAAAYGGFALATTLLWPVSAVLSLALATIAVALHSSLTHEVLHGHPTRDDRVNQALVFPAIGLLYPYGRFRDLHLAHHNDPDLTDPYDDPETNYLDPAVWTGLPAWTRAILRFNNTLFGRLTIGTLVGGYAFFRSEAARLSRAGGRSGMGAACGRCRACRLLVPDGRVDAGLGLASCGLWGQFADQDPHVSGTSRA